MYALHEKLKLNYVNLFYTNMPGTFTSTSRDLFLYALVYIGAQKTLCI
jgi:hypothetical protein